MRFYCLIIYILMVFINIGCKADDSPGFFLKITKNIPRLGRRSDKDFENSFLKNYKTIPRIGRSVGNNNDFLNLEDWLNEQQSLNRPNKRVLLNPSRIPSPERELSVVQPVNANTLIELLEKDAIPSDNVKFVHWKDFDRALQLDMDLYAKVISLGRRPDHRLKQDLSIRGYTPLYGNELEDETNNRGGNLEGNFNSDLLHYNRI